MSEAIIIRHSTHADVALVAELAELDGRRAPAGEALLAYVDGELRAAVGIGDGRAVADPFHPTDDVVRLLLLRAAQEREDDRVSRAAAAPSPRRGRRRASFVPGPPRAAR